VAATFKDLIKFGVQKEMNAESFYRHWAGAMSGGDQPWPRAKTLLLQLADEENGHQSLFDTMKWTEVLKGDIPETLDVSVEDYSSTTELKADASVTDVVLCAISREDMAIRFYTTLAALGGNVGKIFEQLAEQEKDHKLRLENFHNEHLLTWD